MGKKFNEAIRSEIENGNFEKNIKDKCAWCNASIPTSTDYHITYGNSCTECSARAGNMVYGVRKVVKNASGNRVMQKIRDFTEDERKELILKRLKNVKEQKL